MPKRETAFVERMRTVNASWEHTLWTSDNLPSMPDHIGERFHWRMQQHDFAFAVDILRVYVVWAFGGVYLDVDTETKEGFEGMHIEDHDGVFRHHQEVDKSFSNDFLGFTKGHAVGSHLLELIQAPHYDYGPHWLGFNVKRYLGLSVEAPHADVRSKLAEQNMLYVPSAQEDGPDQPTYWYKHFGNASLYSWSKEARERFASGNYE
jgi:hypothetical protein